MLVIIGVISGIATVLGLAWGVYTYYKPRTQQAAEQPTQPASQPRLSQCLPAKTVNEAVVFLDWIQKNHNAYVRSYPSFVAIRPYLTILQQDGFISRSDASNMQGDIFELTAQGQKALMAAGVELVVSSEEHTVRDDVAKEADYMKITAENLRAYALSVQEKGAVPFSSKQLRKRGRELLKELESTRRNISNLGQLYEEENGKSDAAEEITKVAAEIAGEIGGLSAILDLATGELPGYSNADRGSADVGKDFMKTSEYLRRLATRLARLRVS